MPISKAKAMYFWHRYLEGADPETRTLRKWNAGYPDDQTTLEEITGFIAEMLRLKEDNPSDRLAMESILNLESVPMHAPALKVHVGENDKSEKPKRTTWRKK